MPFDDIIVLVFCPPFEVTVMYYSIKTGGESSEANSPDTYLVISHPFRLYRKINFVLVMTVSSFSCTSGRDVLGLSGTFFVLVVPNEFLRLISLVSYRRCARSQSGGILGTY